MRFDVGTRYIQTPGTYSRVSFTFDRDPVLGDQVSIDLPLVFGGQLIWQCQIGSNFGFVPGVFSEDYIDNELIPNLLNIPEINQNFIVSRDGLNIVIEAVDYGGEFNVNVGDYVQGQDLITSESFSSVDPVTVNNYLVRCRIHMETYQDSGYFEPSEWLFYRPDEDGDVMIDLSQKVDQLFDELDSKQGSESSVQKAQKSARKFRVEFAEHMGANPYNQETDPWQGESLVTDFFRVLKGSMSQHNYGSGFQTEIWAAKKFVTNKSSGESAHIDQPQFLSFFLNYFFIDDDDVTIVAKVWYEDGTTAQSILDIITTGSFGELHTVPVGFKQRGLQNLEPTKTPYKYSIRAYGTLFQIEVAQEFEFRLPVPSTYANFVMYHNAYGLPETLCFEGGHSWDESFNRNIVKKTRSLNETYQDSDAHVYGVTRTPVIEMSTGAVENVHQNAVKDCMMSRKHWVRMLSRGNPEFIAATLTSDAFSSYGYGKEANHAVPNVLVFQLNESKGNDINTLQ